MMQASQFEAVLRDKSKIIELYEKRSNVGHLLGITYDTDLMFVEVGISKQEKLSITIPLLHIDSHGLQTVRVNGVERAVGSWALIADEQVSKNIVKLSYWELMAFLFSENVSQYLPTLSKRCYFNRLAHSFRYNQSAVVFNNFQRVIDDIINRLPLVETPMQRWAMCNRIQIIDKTWESLTPSRKLLYQTELNYHNFPYTSLGQSDSGMCQNTLLTVDVRKTIPFGIGHHNPHRNLYQTLGMKGDELPVVYSTTEYKLKNKGVVRKGWNLLTAFIDTPSNFEDQLIVSDRLLGLYVTEYAQFTTYGDVIVDEGDELEFLQPLAIDKEGATATFDRKAESAWVEKIIPVKLKFNGQKVNATRIKCGYKRTFKDGVKLTNRHGNKGVIHITDTGYIEDPIRGKVPIDIIVSASSVRKRRNFGQLLEALLTLLRGTEKEIILADDVSVTEEQIKNALTEKGYNEDGTVPTVTQWGRHNAVAGWIHWGCIKTPEDQLWTKHDTTQPNENNVRIAGNKISHIEMKALFTIFGVKNPVIKEIMEYQQGDALVFPAIEILEKTISQEKDDCPVITSDMLAPITQSLGTFYPLEDLDGTIADVNTYPDGCWLSFPEGYGYLLGNDKNTFGKIEKLKDMSGRVISKIFLPKASLRKPWKHSTGLYGLTDFAAHANNLIMSFQAMSEGADAVTAQTARKLFLYLNHVTEALTGKRGLLSTYAMAIRYPNSVKATACVSEHLDKNEIEIHEHMAAQLGVHDGDFVLVERFPCLGFMSLRVQRVKTTKDIMAKYVIRVSGNSLASQNLDFDGDVIYLMSFKTAEANRALANEFSNPSKERLEAYKKAEDKKIPCIEEFDLSKYGIESFGEITQKQNMHIVEGLTGIKRGTGTVVAFCYNIMRMLERTTEYGGPESVGMEVLIDKVANSVFSQKHAGKSLEVEAKRAICLADVDAMKQLGFHPQASEQLAAIIRKEASSIGIGPNKLKQLYEKRTRDGGTSIINILVRKKNKTWFASRAALPAKQFVQSINSTPCDVPSYMFNIAKEKYKCHQK